MAILVTGGAGYIGSHACVELQKNGYDVIILDNFSNSNPAVLTRIEAITGKKMKVYKADLMDKEAIVKVFIENEIEAVLHFAGLKAVGESMTEPLKYYQHNVIATIQLCDVMLTNNVKSIVFSSSATVYGMPDQMPIGEENELNALNPYGRSKQMIESLLHDLYQADQTWRIAILRYFNPIGAHPGGQIGEDPNGIPNNLLPYIAQVASGQRSHLSIFGNDYPTKDGTGIRDYIHVTDLAGGHVKALKHLESTPGIDIFNLGTGKGYSVLEVVDAFERASGRDIPYIFTQRREGDVPICYANPAKAKTILNWEAKRGIQEMCDDTWRWQYMNPLGYKQISDTALKRHDTEATPLHQSTGFLMS